MTVNELIKELNKLTEQEKNYPLYFWISGTSKRLEFDKVGNTLPVNIEINLKTCED